MTVTAVRKDPASLSLELEAEFEATPERVWELWADPRQLERWWGPPTYPATFTAHDLRAGGRIAYHMTGPTGDQPRGYWIVDEVDPPRTIRFRDGFADAAGQPDPSMPESHALVTIEDLGAGRTRMTLRSVFADLASMERLIEMGIEEGLKSAVGQIDAILAEDA